MPTTQPTYAANTPIAITSAVGLADAGWCSSALVDNQVTRYMDAIVGGIIQVGSVPAGGGSIEFYLAASWDGVKFTAGASIGDSVITWGATGNTHGGGALDVFRLGTSTVINTDLNLDIKFGPFSVARALHGVMPRRWCVLYRNRTQAAFHATGANNVLEFTGITYTST